MKGERSGGVIVSNDNMTCESKYMITMFFQIGSFDSVIIPVPYFSPVFQMSLLFSINPNFLRRALIPPLVRINVTAISEIGTFLLNSSIKHSSCA